jgi:hypothetical protein
VQALVSCLHCKRAVLMAPGKERRDVMRLRDHLADCRPDDPSEVVRDADVLRHFRVVLIETVSEFARRTDCHSAR